MEATTISEVARQPEHLKNQNLIIMKIIGICEIDKNYLDNGDGELLGTIPNIASNCEQEHSSCYKCVQKATWINSCCTCRRSGHR